MKGKAYFKKVLIVWAICLLILASIPLALGESTGSEHNSANEDNVNTRDSKHYTNCRILIIGRCNTVTGPLVWLFGFYCPLVERNFGIKANGELGEKLNVFVISPEFGSFISYEHIDIDIYNAKGDFYWGEKSLIFNGPTLLISCKATDVWINY